MMTRRETTVVLMVGLMIGVLAGAGRAVEYRVHPGDTLFRIAARELGSGNRWSEIAALNGLSEPYTIDVGQMLMLPDREETTTAQAGFGGRESDRLAQERLRSETRVDSLAGHPVSPARRPVSAPHDAAETKTRRVGPDAMSSRLQPQSTAALGGEPLSMSRAVAMAWERSPEIRMAEAQLDRARGGIGVAASGGLPQVNGVLDLRRHETVKSNMNTDLDANIPSAGVSVSQTLFDFGRLSQAIHAARSEEAAALAALADARLGVRLRVETAFLNELLTKDRLLVATESLEVAQALLERASLRERAGVGTHFDVTRAEAEVAATTARLAAARAEVDGAHEDLAVAMGLNAETRFDLEGALALDADLREPVDPVEAEKLALAERPDLAAFSHRINASRAMEASENARGLPSLQAYASANYAYYDYATRPAQYRGNENTVGIVGMAVSVPIFDGHRVRETVRMQNAATQSLVAQRDRLRLDAIRDVRRGYLDLGAARSALAARQAGTQAAREALSIAQISFEAGHATSLDVIQASLVLADARRAESETAFQYRLGLSRLVKATGTDAVLNPD